MWWLLKLSKKYIKVLILSLTCLCGVAAGHYHGHTHTAWVQGSLIYARNATKVINIVLYREGLMSYKQFIQELEDDISPVEAQSRWAIVACLWRGNLWQIMNDDPTFSCRIQWLLSFTPCHQNKHFSYVQYYFSAVNMNNLTLYLTYLRYEEYKSEYIRTQKKAYFDLHKNEDW